MKTRFKKIDFHVISPSVIIFISALIAVGVSMQQYLLPLKSYSGDNFYPQYNNYLIFKSSFSHLISQTSLYISHPQDHWDLFKYSPSFAVFMGVFSVLPDVIGLFLWNFLGIGLLTYCLSYLFPSVLRKSIWGWLLILNDMIASTQNAQSNCLIAGLLLLSWLEVSKNRNASGALWFCLCGLIKVYSLAFLPLLFWNSKKPLQLLGYAIGWGILLIALPLIFTDIDGLIFQYTEWIRVIKMDADQNLGLSIWSILSLFDLVDIPKLPVVFIGYLICLSPILLQKTLKRPEQIINKISIGTLFIWMIIFNYRAESATYIIAQCGAAIAIWALFPNRKTFIITCIFLFILGWSNSFLFPLDWAHYFTHVIFLKPWGLFVFWITIILIQLYSVFYPNSILNISNDYSTRL